MEVTTHGRRVYAGIGSGPVQRQQCTLSIADDADGAFCSLLEPIDGGEDFLHLVADDVPAQFEGCPIDKFAVWLVGHGQPSCARIGGAAVDQQRHQHAAAIFGQAPGKLGGRGHPRFQTHKHFRSPVAVGQGHHICLGVPIRLEQQALCLDAFDYCPAHRKNLVPTTLGQLSLRSVFPGHIRRNLELDRRALIYKPNDLREVLAIFFAGLDVVCMRGKIPFPVPRPALDRGL